MTYQLRGLQRQNRRASPQRILDGIERVGNKVPHPVLMFLYLILIVIVLSHVLYLFGVSVTEQIAVQVEPALVVDYYEDTTQPGLWEMRRRIAWSTRFRNVPSPSAVC